MTITECDQQSVIKLIAIRAYRRIFHVRHDGRPTFVAAFISSSSGPHARDARPCVLRFVCVVLAGEVPGMAGPGNEMAAGAAGRGRLRASHADREQVIDTLKTAFVRGVLAKDEFDLRVGLTFASRTNAELAALTADLPARLTAAQPPGPVRARGERPVLRPGPWITVSTALCAGMWAFALLFRWPRNSDGDLTPGNRAGLHAHPRLLVPCARSGGGRGRRSA